MALLKSKPLMWAIVVMTQSCVTDRSHLHFFLKKKKHSIPSPIVSLTHALTLSGSSLHKR